MAQLVPLVAALFVYAGAVVWLTWPLGAQLTTHLPNTAFSCPFDPLLFAWASARTSRVLFTAPSQLLHGNIFHPDPYALLYGETGWGALPYFMPPFLFTGNPALALNLTLLGSIVLTAWALHFVVLRWTSSTMAGTVAGTGFLMTRWVLWSHAPCVPTYALLQYFPFVVLLAAEGVRTRRGMALLAGLLIMQGMANAYLALAVLVPLTLLNAVSLVRRVQRPSALRSLGAIAVASVVLFVVYGGHLLLRTANPDLASHTWWDMRLEDRLPFGPFSYMTPLGSPLILTVLGLAGSAMRLASRERDTARTRVWTVLWFWVIAGVLLSLPPVAWWRDAKFTLPHLALPLRLGVYNVIRIPDRLGVGALIGLCLMAGLAFAELTAGVAQLRRAASRIDVLAARAVCGVVVLACAYGEYAYGLSWGPLSILRAQGFRVRFPAATAPFDPPAQYFFVQPLPRVYPLQPTIPRDGPLTEALRAARGPLLEVPVGKGGGGTPALQARAEYRSIFHGRPLVNGYSGYFPHTFPARMALARQLPDPAALARLRQDTGLESILVHLEELSPDERQRWLAAQTGRPDLPEVRQVGQELLFTVASSTTEP